MVEFVLTIDDPRASPCAGFGASAILRRLAGADVAPAPDEHVLLGTVPRHRGVAGSDGSLVVTPETASILATSRIDVYVSLGVVGVSDGIARTARHGLLVFRHDLAEASRGTPPGFWEVLSGLPLTRVALLRQAPAGTTVIRSGLLRTERHSLRRNSVRIYRALMGWLPQACREMSRADDLPPTSEAAASGSGPPTMAHVALLLLRVFARRARLAWQRFFRHAQWNIGVIEAPISDCLDWHTLPPIHWRRATRDTFFADPFALVERDRVTILCEAYPYGTGRGHIVRFELGDGLDRCETETVLRKDHHLSYPYTIQTKAAVYCVPESFRLREIALYRASPTLQQWTKIAVLVDGFAGTDPTVFQHGGRWWLMSTDADRGADSHLCVWHADALEGPWIPHERNPVKVDVRSARPGGTPFAHHGEFYRPAQDCSERYGGRIVINRVLTLTPSDFAEEIVAALDPNDARFPHGFHTISAAGAVTLVDGLRYIFSPAAAWRFLGIWMRNTFRPSTGFE